MTRDTKNEPFVFFRKNDDGKEFFYIVEIPRDQVLVNMELNPGTLRIEDISGSVIWRPQ